MQTDHITPARACRIVYFTFIADNRVKIKESEQRDKYLDLARNLSNMKMTVILIEIWILATVPKGLERGLVELKIGG